MNISYKINGKKNIDSSSEENLQKFLRKNGCKSVKLGCSKGFCGNCMILLNDSPVPSCKISFASLRDDDEIVTYSHFMKNYPEAKDISRGFEKAGINLCGYCDAGKFFTAYDLIKHEKPSREIILNAVRGLNTCCTDDETLCDGILFAYDIKAARKEKESNSIGRKKTVTLTNESESNETESNEKNVAVKQEKNVEPPSPDENDGSDEKIIFPTSMQKLFSAMEAAEDFSISAGGTYEAMNDDSVDIQISGLDFAPPKKATVISLKKIPELMAIEKHERYIEIGAAASLNSVMKNQRVPKILRDAISEIASHSMRNVSTIGGNICIPDHRGSTWSALLALDAKFEISYPKDHKEIRKIVKAYEFKNLGRMEILTKIRIPITNWNFSIYRRLGQSDFLSGKSAGFSFLAETEREHIYNIRISFSGNGELSQHDEIFRHNKKSLHKRVKYGFSSDLIGQKVPLPEKIISTCITNAGKIFSEKCNRDADPMLEQQFKTLLRTSLEMLV
ncbi:MAG: FAD binding domain-containing protein [Treponema sp.]|nr:FAD binding domain-containing protein [Treponema sp.]